MKVLVTGAAGQLGHDVMNELNKRGYTGVGSDLKPEYSGVQDGSPVTYMPYIGLDITDEEAVHRVIRPRDPGAEAGCDRSLCGLDRRGCSGRPGQCPEGENDQCGGDGVYCRCSG